ncbi:MAG: phage holin family protein [Glaciihabitans sp.]
MTEPVRDASYRDKKRSIFQLISDVPTLVRDLVKGEIELLKTEIIAKLKIAGIGVGLILGAVIVLFFFIGVLLTAGILGLATVMPGWLAALIVAFVLLIAIAILAWIGYRELKKAMPPLPEATIKNVKRDINAIRGVGKRPKI